MAKDSSNNNNSVSHNTHHGGREHRKSRNHPISFIFYFLITTAYTSYESLVLFQNLVHAYTPRQTAVGRALDTNNNGRVYFG